MKWNITESTHETVAAVEQEKTANIQTKIKISSCSRKITPLIHM